MNGTVGQICRSNGGSNGSVSWQDWWGASRPHLVIEGSRPCAWRRFPAAPCRCLRAPRSRHAVLFYRRLVHGGVNVPVRRHRATTVKKTEPKKETRFGEMPRGPLQLVVSINTQKVTLFSNGVRVSQGPVSTGVPGHPTPMGVFSVIEKDRYHHSNIYSGAPMPYMQRITWSGVALHEGVLPGHPDSHGCIRMSHDFAMRLWPITKLGVRVIVARDELTPTEFAHAKLFVPRSKPEPQTTMNV